jgi:hypothetical protein
MKMGDSGAATDVYDKDFQIPLIQASIGEVMF